MAQGNSRLKGIGQYLTGEMHLCGLADLSASEESDKSRRRKERKTKVELNQDKIIK
jgi:hypothetical protein